MIDLRTKSEVFDDGTFVVTVNGELDLYSAPQLESELAELLQRNVRSVVVDLTECEFIDSTALVLLVKANKRLGAAQAGFSIVNPGPQYPEDLRDHRPRPRAHDPPDSCGRHERRAPRCLAGRIERRVGEGFSAS
jgi:anti-anti-sigma factor